MKAPFTIYYDGGTKRYDLEQTLKPHDEMWVDVGELIHEQVPDRNGLLLPSDLTMGSYELQDLTDRGVGNLFEGKVILDKTFGHVSYGCSTCCGEGTAPWMYWDPIDVALALAGDQDVWDTDFCSGTSGSVLGAILPSSWDTGNHAIATASNAKITGVAVGSTTNLAQGSLIVGGAMSHRCPLADVFPSGPANVTPTVTISGPTNIPMLAPGTQGTDSIAVTATANPSGGTYSWTAVSGGSNITILNDTSQSAILQSVAVGTYTVQVTYTVNNQSATATTVGKVQQPGSLGVISNTTPLFNCGNTGLPAYNTTDRLIQYEVLDTSSPAVPIPAANMFASETTLNVISNTCNIDGPSPTINRPTLSNGYFGGPDTLQLCSAQCLPANSQGGPSGSCTMTVAQAWSVNGYPVKSDTLTYSCPGPPTGAP